MKKKMMMVTILSLIGLVASGAICYVTKSSVCFSVAITFGTTFYHFAMRLMVGYLIGRKYQKHMDPTNKWFAQKPFEPKLYKLLQVKKWKKRLPTYNPQDFDLKNHSMEEIVQVMCQSEVVHEVIMVLSFVPIIFTVWFGSMGVFVLTSCVACLFDGMFVIMQRYNRPRLMRVMKKIPRK